MNNKRLLTIDSLSIRLTGETIPGRGLVNNVSLHVDRGRVTGLIGESGSGKSLTCLAAMNLLPPTMFQSGGTINIGTTTLSPGQQSIANCYRGKKAALILQNPASCFDPIFTIGHHIRETLSAHNISYRRRLPEINEKLVNLGFENPSEILGAYPFQLSGGMLQRIMICLAMLLNVELLIADEPTTDLDVLVQARILDLLDSLRREKNIGILLITHDLSVIARLADHVAVMQTGSIVEDAPVTTLFTNSRHPYTKRLLAAHFSLYSQSIPKVTEYECA